MKTTKMTFGFSAVNNGQRNANVEPQVLAVSTEGGFRLTPMVSRILGIAAGDYVMFLSNATEIDTAIDTRNEVIVEFCENNGLDITTPEAALAIHKEFDMWAIAKGIKEYDSKGNEKEVDERLSKEDKIRYVSQNYQAFYDEVVAGVEDEATKEALTREDATREEIIELLIHFVELRKVAKYKGSKTANPAGMTGTNVTLNFTDTNVWKQLKADLKENATKINRIFSVNVEDIQTITIFNGYEDVEVRALILGESTDKEPARKGAGDKSAYETKG